MEVKEGRRGINQNKGRNRYVKAGREEGKGKEMV